MMLLYLLLLLMFEGFVYASKDGPEWGYDKTHGKVYGPKDWGNVSKICADGKRQSPVNINTYKAKAGKYSDIYMGGKRLVKYDTRYGDLVGDLTNNGHSPTYHVTKGEVTFMNPARNNAQYKLHQFHFHFGCKDNVGSEHTINEKSYAGEMHLVFFKDQYETLENAMTKGDGLTVIGVFLKKANFRNSWQLRQLARHMPKLSEGSEPLKNIEVKLSNLVPGLNRAGFLDHYSYNGSLTTPGCHESVNWRVLKRPINANDFVLKNFRTLTSGNAENCKMCNNFRPIQALNGRNIEKHD